MVNKNLIIRINEHPNKSKWDEYVLQHPQGNIFQTSGMFDVYNTTPNCHAGVIAIENPNGEILGLMVYSIITESGFKSRFSARSIISGGPLITDNNPDYTKLLLSGYNKIISKTNTIYSEIRNLFNIDPLRKALEDQNYVYEDHLTIHMNLTQPAEVLEKALHRGRASNIRRAVKKGVLTRDISSKEEINRAYEIINDTYLRIGLPSPSPELFHNASKFLQGGVKFFAAFIADKMIACRMYLLYNGMMYDWYAAGDRAYTGFHSSDLLPWHAMLWGKQNNFKIYDFAGAGKPGKEYTVRDYKLQFGGTLLNFGRYQYIHKPVLFRVGVLGLKIYKYIR